jgi:hypothetical protein
MKLTGQLEQVADLTADQRDQMFALMDRHYRNMVRERFEADLAEKDWAILVSDPRTGALRGFSTQMMLEVEVDGRPLRALFSGDTIVDRQSWGDPALAHVWGRLALALMDRQDAETPLYWFLISKGYKTYRFLPLFFREFYPGPEAQTPPWARAVLDALARSKFPDAYDASAGIIRSDGFKDCLRDGVAPVSEERGRDPFVRYFVERNPGHVRGDELCCLASLTRANFTPAAYRVIGGSARLALSSAATSADRNVCPT